MKAKVSVGVRRRERGSERLRQIRWGRCYAGAVRIAVRPSVKVKAFIGFHWGGTAAHQRVAPRRPTIT